MISAFSKQDWFAQIYKHAIDNGYALPENWREIAEDQCCRTLSGEWCEGGKPESFINTTRFTMLDFIRGTGVAASMLASPDAIVSQEVADERALICSRCFANVNVPGCKACHQIANVVISLKGARKTPYDHLLKACGICACSNEAAVWVSIEHLAKGITEEHEKQYEQVQDCWKIKELQEWRTSVKDAHGN